MNKNILIFLNTDYHFETALSIYKSVELFGYKPYILLDYALEFGDYNPEIFLQTYNIKYILPEQFDKNYTKDFFYKMFVITCNNNKNVNEIYQESPPMNYNHRMQLFKDRAILIYHRADYEMYLKSNSKFFENPKAVSVSQFSQKYNLDYIHQIENPLEEISYIYKNDINKPLNLIMPSRFNLYNRTFMPFNGLLNVDKKIDKKIKINLIGQKPDQNKLPIELINLEKYNFENIQIHYDFNLDQINFYKKIMEADIFMNLLSKNFYLTNRFSSNINHIISFAKPNISPLTVNLVYNIPSITYTNVENFTDNLINLINNFTQDLYKDIQSKFTSTKENLRTHNNMILNKLFI